MFDLAFCFNLRLKQTIFTYNSAFRDGNLRLARSLGLITKNPNDRTLSGSALHRSAQSRATAPPIAPSMRAEL